LAVEEPHVLGLVPAKTVVSASLTWRGGEHLTEVATWRENIINVKVGSATHLAVRSIISTMPGRHRRLAFTSDILVLSLVGVLVFNLTRIEPATKLTLVPLATFEITPGFNDCNHGIIRLAVTVLILQALQTKRFIVNLSADGVAVLVHDFTVLIEAVLGSTSGNQLILGWSLKQNIHIALNLFRGRPVDLAIFLQALGLAPLCSNCCFTLCPAPLIGVLAVHIVACVPLTVSSLTFCLLAVTLCVLLHVHTVRVSAGMVEKLPRLIGLLKLGDLLLQPSPNLTIHLQMLDCVFARSLAIPGRVWEVAASLVKVRWARRDCCVDEMIQISALRDVVLVEDEQ